MEVNRASDSQHEYARHDSRNLVLDTDYPGRFLASSTNR